MVGRSHGFLSALKIARESSNQLHCFVIPRRLFFTNSRDDCHSLFPFVSSAFGAFQLLSGMVVDENFQSVLTDDAGVISDHTGKVDNSDGLQGVEPVGAGAKSSVRSNILYLIHAFNDYNQ